MLNRRITVMTAMAIFFFTANNLYGEWKGLFISWIEDKCINGTIHTITYYSVLGGAFPFVVLDVDTKNPCCNQTVQSNLREGFQPRDASSCSPSTPRSQGGTQTNAGTVAPVTNTGGTGPGGVGPAGRSQSLVLSSLQPPVLSAATSALPRVAVSSGSTAYVPKVPFRPFALPPYLFGSASPPNVSPKCNSQVNPTAYQVNHNVATVSRINLCTGAVGKTIQVGPNPLEVAVTPDGKWAVVSGFYNTISFINTDNDTVAKVIQTDSNTFPFGVAIAPDGSYALVVNFNNVNMDLVIVDLQTQAITGTIPLDRQYPQSVFLNPDATLAWVTYPFENVVEAIDLLTGTVNFAISVMDPLDVVFNATGTVAYMASGTPGSVVAVNTSTYAVIANIPTAAGSNDLLLSPDGGFLTLNNYFDGSISVIDAIALKNILTKPLGTAPFGSALVPIE